MNRMSRTEFLREIQSALNKVDHDDRRHAHRHSSPESGSTDCSSAEDDEGRIFVRLKDVEYRSCSRLKSTTERRHEFEICRRRDFDDLMKFGENDRFHEFGCDFWDALMFRRRLHVERMMIVRKTFP